jgi:hypothetical protein
VGKDKEVPIPVSLKEPLKDVVKDPDPLKEPIPESSAPVETTAPQPKKLKTVCMFPGCCHHIKPRIEEFVKLFKLYPDPAVCHKELQKWVLLKQLGWKAGDSTMTPTTYNWHYKIASSDMEDMGPLGAWRTCGASIHISLTFRSFQLESSVVAGWFISEVAWTHPYNSSREVWFKR